MHPLALLAVVLVFMPSGLFAAPITYNLAGTADGVFGDRGFDDTALAFIGTADTDDIVRSSADGIERWSVELGSSQFLLGDRSLRPTTSVTANFATTPEDFTFIFFDFFEADGSTIHQLGAVIDTLAIDTTRSFAALVGDSDVDVLAPGLSTNLGPITFSDVDLLTFSQFVVPLPAGWILLATGLGVLVPARLLRRRHPGAGYDAS